MSREIFALLSGIGLIIVLILLLNHSTQASSIITSTTGSLNNVINALDLNGSSSKSKA